MPLKLLITKDNKHRGDEFMDKSEALSILEQSKPSCTIRQSIASSIGEDAGFKQDFHLYKTR